MICYVNFCKTCCLLFGKINGKINDVTIILVWWFLKYVVGCCVYWVWINDALKQYRWVQILFWRIWTVSNTFFKYQLKFRSNNFSFRTILRIFLSSMFASYPYLIYVKNSIKTLCHRLCKMITVINNQANTVIIDFN